MIKYLGYFGIRIHVILLSHERDGVCWMYTVYSSFQNSFSLSRASPLVYIDLHYSNNKKGFITYSKSLFIFIDDSLSIPRSLSTYR